MLGRLKILLRQIKAYHKVLEGNFRLLTVVRYMAEILSIWRKAQINQSIDQTT